MITGDSGNPSAILARNLLAYWQQTARSSEYPSSRGELLETHISWLILLPDRVYKLKKSVNLGFVDFSTLEKRKHYCEEEVRLNRRTAPDIYECVLPVSGTPEQPFPADDSDPIDYLVQMKRFPANSLLSDIVARKHLDSSLISSLAETIALFHLNIKPLNSGESGSSVKIMQPVIENFLLLEKYVVRQDIVELISRVKSWTLTRFENIQPRFAFRKSEGHIRECHGDLHLGNIFVENHQPVLFDCIEFNTDLRQIDTASDLAFILMDLESRSLDGFARQLLNEYLEITGDYSLLSVLDFYKTYRAVVRAKVNAVRASQDSINPDAYTEACNTYLKLGFRYSNPKHPFLLIMCGLSGTGKTTIARKLAEVSGAIPIRSDVERKRLFGLEAGADSRAAGVDIYSDSASNMTFEQLASLSRNILEYGYPLIVDATFINRSLREQFQKIAAARDVPFRIIHLTASSKNIKKRLEERKGDASEAGFTQYLSQKAVFEPFSDGEKSCVFHIDTDTDANIEEGLRMAALFNESGIHVHLNQADPEPV